MKGKGTQRGSAVPYVLLILGCVVVAAAFLKLSGRKPIPPPYTPAQKKTISAWMDKHPRDAAWIDSVRDHIVSQGMLFQDDMSQDRIYVVRDLKPSQVLSRTMWPFLKQGFIYFNPFTGISRMDLPNTDDYDQFFIEYMPDTYSYEWYLGKETGTGPYHLRDLNITHIGRAKGSDDEVITEGCNIFEKAAFRNQKMAELVDEFGFNPKRGNWLGETKYLVTSVTQKSNKTEQPHKWNHDAPEFWMAALQPHIASTKYTPSDKDERREYELKDIKMSQVVQALRKPLSKFGFNADTSIYEKDEEMNGSGRVDATFLPRRWNADAAKIGLVAVEAVHEEGAANIRIIELYGLPVTK